MIKPDFEKTGRAHIRFFNCDCMEFMEGCGDDEYSLLISDPPYGINIVKEIRKANIGGNKCIFKTMTCGDKHDFDDEIPPEEYFIESIRASHNQIIWGGNYFIDYLKNTRCMLIWDKMNGGNNLADAEIAWSSFSTSVRIFKMHHFSAGYGKKIHPTQKPVALYKWLLKNYAKPGDTILDTHGGSMSIAIACWDYGFDLDICELDKDYFKAGVERFERHTAQLKLF